MEILEFILGFLFFCGITAGFSYLSKGSEECEEYMREMYGCKNHEYHN